MESRELFCDWLWHSFEIVERIEEYMESTTCSATPCWIFDECLDDSAGEVANAITQEMEYPGAAEKGGQGGLQPLWNKLWGGLAPSKISVALVESLKIF